MADFTLTATPALTAAPADNSGTRLAALDAATCLTLVLRPDHPALAAEIKSAFATKLPAVGASTPARGGTLLRPTAERAYLIDADPAATLPAPAPAFSALDQSDFWATMALTGPAARATLRRNWKPDLSDTAFPPGAATLGDIAHIAALLHRAGPDSYRIMVPRSYAASGWHALATSLAWLRPGET